MRLEIRVEKLDIREVTNPSVKYAYGKKKRNIQSHLTFGYKLKSVYTANNQFSRKQETFNDS